MVDPSHHEAAPELVVMAAGLGKRFGGLKQLEPVGPGGEPLMDYAIFDAARSGVRRVIFVIRRSLEREFHEAAGRRYARRLDVVYAFQEIDDLPGGFRPPHGRSKPWGTGHALLAARGLVRTPFVVVNADDFYGAEAFNRLVSFLRMARTGAIETAALGAFRLENTLSETGPVSRGVCEVGEDGALRAVVEHTRIERVHGEIVDHGGGSPRSFTGRERVSMNLWGFRPAVLDLVEERFEAFLAARGADPAAEFYLPGAVSDLIRDGRLRVRVLDTEARWLGMTYREDAPAIAERLRELTVRGDYPPRLWE